MTLKIDNLSKKVRERWTVRDVSFELKKGEVLGVFGNSQYDIGSFLNLISGADKQDEGEIFLDDKEISKLNPDQRGIRFPKESADSNDSLLGSIFKSKSTEESTDFDQISNFEKVLDKAENVLILNNPFESLNRIQSDDLADKIRNTARKKNLAVIFNSTNFEENFSVCDRVVVLYNGRIVQTGTPRGVYEKPISSVVASLTGRNNLITARRITSSKVENPEFQTLNGEHRLFTEKVEKKALGAINQNIILAIRPEHISISFGASFPADNLLKAEITSIKYLGATTLIELDANGLKLKTLVLRLVGLNIGDECVVGLPPDRILVLKD